MVSCHKLPCLQRCQTRVCAVSHPVPCGDGRPPKTTRTESGLGLTIAGLDAGCAAHADDIRAVSS